jgi:ankyrin repeat protein
MRASTVILVLVACGIIGGCASRAARESLEARGVPFDEQSFMARIHDGDVEAVRAFLKAGMPAGTRDEETHTALMWAAEAGRDTVVALLLAAGANPNDRIRRRQLIEIPFLSSPREHAGWTALVFAIRSGHGGIVRRLVGTGADVHAVDPEGGFGMADLACMENDLEMVEILLARGAPVDHLDNMGRTALHLAAQNGNPEMVRLLIDRKADVNVRSHVRPETPRTLAAQGGQAEVVELLLAAGADPDAVDHFGRTALIYAENAGRRDMAAMLRARGASEAGLGDDRLVEAMERGDLVAAREALQHGANPNVRYANRLGGRPAIVNAVDASSTDGVRLLLAAGADANAVDDLGSSALHAAGRLGNGEAIRLLIRAGADPNLRDRNQWTPLLQAAHSGQAKAIEALVEGGAHVDEPSHDGATPLIIAANGGDVMTSEEMNVEVASALLRLEASLNATDHLGATAQIRAVRMRRPRMVAWLLRAGADVSLATSDGETALSIAAGRGYEEIESQLRATGPTR